MRASRDRSRCLISFRETASQIPSIRQLQRSEELFRLLAENATDMISKHTPDGLFTYVSPACVSLLGFQPDELIGTDPYDRFHPEDLEAIQHSHTSILDAPETQFVEYRNLRKDGHYIWLETTSRSIRDPRTGQIVELIAVTRDISERRDAEERDRRHLEDLAHVSRLATLGELTTGIAHELNQPLSAVVNYASAAVRRLAEGERIDRADLMDILSRASEQANRAGEIMKELRSLVRKADTSRSKACINTLIQRVIEILSIDLRATGTRLTLVLGDDLPELRVNVVQIEQVILNLGKNAIEAMHETPRKERRLEIRTELVDGHGVRASFRDSGCGIPEDMTEKVFESFFTAKPNGVGFGLSISRSIVEAHGGRMNVTSDSNGGAMFAFTLPVTQGGEVS